MPSAIRFAVAFSIAALLPVTSQASDLEKADAGKIISYMGCFGAAVVAVVNFGPTAKVIAECLEGGVSKAREYTLSYDKDWGWFFYEIPNLDNTLGMNYSAAAAAKLTTKVRIWTVKGYQEFSISPPAPAGMVRCQVPNQAAIGFYKSVDACTKDGGKVVP